MKFGGGCDALFNQNVTHYFLPTIGSWNACMWPAAMYYSLILDLWHSIVIFNGGVMDSMVALWLAAEHAP